MSRSIVSRAIVVGTVCSAVLCLAACTPTAPAGRSTSPDTKSNSAAALLPKTIKSQGYITLATNATAPPDEYVAPDGKTLLGVDIEIGDELGRILGLKIHWENVGFDSIIPGIQGGRYDAGIAGFGDTKAREQVVDFVDYLNGPGEMYFVNSAVTAKIGAADSVCGHTVAAQAGTLDLQNLQMQSAKCSSAGKKPVVISVFGSQSEVTLAVANGRVEIDQSQRGQSIQWQAEGHERRFCKGGLGHSVLKGFRLRPRTPCCGESTRERA
jgi:polar amino acid transport system substrate-binding protein